MKIGIFPTIREPYKKQFELSCDKNLFKFFNFVFKKKIEFRIIYAESEIKDIDFLVISGGNDIFKKNMADKLRFNLSKKIILKAISLKKKIFGICYGAQIIAKLFGSKFVKKKDISKEHFITLVSMKKKVKVNSFHNYEIVKINKKFSSIAINENKYVESFYSKKLKILCVMWHPERYTKFKNFDKKLIFKYLK